MHGKCERKHTGNTQCNERETHGGTTSVRETEGRPYQDTEGSRTALRVEECTEQRIAKRAGKLKGHKVNTREACEGNKRLNARGYGVTNTQTQQKYGRHSNLPGTHQVTHEDVYSSKHKAQTKGTKIHDMKRMTQRGHDGTDKQTRNETRYELTNGDPQMNERLCVRRKAQKLEGGTEREIKVYPAGL